MFMGLLPAALYTHHMAEADGTGPSGRIMARIAAATSNPDGSDRLVAALEEDFTGHAVIAQSDTEIPTYGMTMSADAAFTLERSATDQGGLVTITAPATINLEAWLGGGAPVQLENSDNLKRTLFFETRVNMTVATGTMFTGLHASGVAATNTLVDTTMALADAAFFGFRKTAAGVLEFVMNKASGNEVVIATNLGPGLDGNGDPDGKVTGTHSLGFIYAQRESSSHDKLEIFVDNVRVATYTAVEFAALAAADLLTTEPMQYCGGFKNEDGTANVMSIDWAYCYSMIP